MISVIKEFFAIFFKFFIFNSFNFGFKNIKYFISFSISIFVIISFCTLTIIWIDLACKVTQDIKKIPDAIAHYESELDKASAEVKLHGNIEKQSASMPGVVESRFRQLQEIEGILKHLEIQARRLKTKHYKKYLENYQRALTSRDAEKYAEGEDEVCNYEAIVNEWALLRNKWLGVIKALDQKQWHITNIVKLRVAGMEDANL